MFLFIRKSKTKFINIKMKKKIFERLSLNDIIFQTINNNNNHNNKNSNKKNKRYTVVEFFIEGLIVFKKFIFFFLDVNHLLE